ARARAALAAAGLQPPAATALATEYGIEGDLLAALSERGDLVRAGPDAVFLPEAVERFGVAVIDELAAAGRITVARARDLTGSSRKHVLPLLQFLDDRGLTRRLGDDRVLVLDAKEARARLARAVKREDRP
ncbi:MAG: SelB C-terminal domain-containing protein, partial [Candidatus Limnocylindria bacterium]